MMLDIEEIERRLHAWARVSDAGVNGYIEGIAPALIAEVRRLRVALNALEVAFFRQDERAECAEAKCAAMREVVEWGRGIIAARNAGNGVLHDCRELGLEKALTKFDEQENAE